MQIHHHVAWKMMEIACGALGLLQLPRRFGRYRGSWKKPAVWQSKLQLIISKKLPELQDTLLASNTLGCLTSPPFMNSSKQSKAGNNISSLQISKINYDASLSDLQRIILSLASPEVDYWKIFPERCVDLGIVLSFTPSGFHNPFEEYMRTSNWDKLGNHSPNLSR